MTSDRFEYEAIVLDTVGEPCEYKIAISVFINFSNLSSQSRCISASKINRFLFFAMHRYFSMIKQFFYIQAHIRNGMDNLIFMKSYL